MKIKIKLLSDNAKVPIHASDGAAGFDLYASRMEEDTANKQIKYHTDVAFEIPKGYRGGVLPRSSVVKTGLRFANSEGVIDSDYRGDVTMVFDVLDAERIYKVGDRIGQIVFTPVPDAELVEAEELSETERGAGGYGSTGVN